MSLGKKRRNKNTGLKANRYGKYTLFVFRGDKRVSISLDLIIVKYFVSYLILIKNEVFRSKRESVEELTKEIQILSDQYQSIREPEFSFKSYIVYHMITKMFRYNFVHKIVVNVDNVNI